MLDPQPEALSLNMIFYLYLFLSLSSYHSSCSCVYSVCVCPSCVGVRVEVSAIRLFSRYSEHIFTMGFFSVPNVKDHVLTHTQTHTACIRPEIPLIYAERTGVRGKRTDCVWVYGSRFCSQSSQSFKISGFFLSLGSLKAASFSNVCVCV